MRGRICNRLTNMRFYRKHAMGILSLRPGRLVSWLIGLIGVVAGSAALAQIPPAGSPVPGVLAPRRPVVAPVSQMPTTPPIRVTQPETVYAVADVAVEGGTLYAPAELAALFGGVRGQATGAQMAAAAQALLERYRADGYLLTTVAPAYVPVTHRLVIRVVEARIAAVRLDGDVGPVAAQIHRFLDPLTEAGPIKQAVLERRLLLAQDIPGISLQGVLQPSEGAPGELVLVAKVARTPFNVLALASNRGAANLGPEQGLLVLSANSFSEYGERSEVSLLRSVNGTQIFGQAASEVFLGGDGLKLRIQAGSGTTDPSGVLRALAYDGVTSTAGVALSYPLIRSRQQSLVLGGNLDLVESHVSETQAVIGRDNLRLARLALDYVGSDLWLGEARGGVNALGLRLSQGVPVFGATRNGDALASRPGERGDFSKAGLEASRTQSLWRWEGGASLAVQTSVAGQISGSVLPPAEKFFLGGDRLNRGYYAGQVTGDSALAASAEVQFNTGWSPDLFGAARPVGVQVYGFYDWGETWENQASDANHRLASFGAGARLTLAPGYELDLEAVDRAVRFPLGRSSAVAALRAQGLFWRLMVRY